MTIPALAEPPMIAALLLLGAAVTGFSTPEGPVTVPPMTTPVSVPPPPDSPDPVLDGGVVGTSLGAVSCFEMKFVVHCAEYIL